VFEIRWRRYGTGHAIYSLDAVKEVIKVSTKTLLEEPRAELTALHTLLILGKTKFVDQVTSSCNRKGPQS